MSSKALVGAMVLCGDADAPRLLALLGQLKLQTSLVLLVDHSGIVNPQRALAVQTRGVHYLAVDSQAGVAAAANCGIQWIMAQHATHVIFLNHDSLPSASMLRQLLFAEKHILSMGISLAAVGPAYFDVRNHRMDAVIGSERCYTRRKYKPDFAMLIEAGYLAFSGQLIRMSVLRQIGLLREELFSEALDIEWSLRAKHEGLRSFVAADALMQHNRGDAKQEMATAELSLQQAKRTYYRLRNPLLLCRMTHIPWPWKVTAILKIFPQVLKVLGSSRPRWPHMLWLLRGLRDGCLAKTGAAVEKRAGAGR